MQVQQKVTGTQQQYYSFRRWEFSTFRIPVIITLLGCGLLVKFSFDYHWFSEACFVAASFFITWHSGFQIDAVNKKQRFYISYMWLKFGSWHELTEFKRITVRRLRSKNSANYTWGQTYSTYYAVFLFNGKDADTVRVFDTGSLAAAQNVAERLSEALQNLPVIQD